MFLLQEHVWFISYVFNTPCPTCAFSMLWSCIAHSHFLHTPFLPLSCIDLYLVSLSQHVLFTLSFVAFYRVLDLSFIFSFILHPSCIFILVHTFIPSFSHLFDPFVYSCQKGGEYTLEQYTREFCHLYMILVHILTGINSISCAYEQGERYSIGEMHIPRERRH